MRFKHLIFASKRKTILKDVFSTDVYTGATPPVSITNDIDLLNEGGIQFFKRRDAASYPVFYDAARLGGDYLQGTCSAGGDGVPFAQPVDIGSWLADGVSITSTDNLVNTSGGSYVVYTFRKSPKFFDSQIGVSVVDDNTISFSDLGTIGMVLCLDVTGEDFYVWHKDLTAGKLLLLNTNAAETTLGAITVSGTDVTLHAAEIASALSVDVMAFAHDPSTVGKIVCGSYTGNGSTTGPIITTGRVPQYIMIKRSIGGTGDWYVLDTERGISESGVDAITKLNLSAADASADILKLTTTGFQLTSSDANVNASGSTYIYKVIH